MFDSGSRNLTPGALARLDSVAATINRYPDADVLIMGHTDSVGDESSNLRLSEDRALMVKNQLVVRGVDPARLTTLGLGESQPLATNATPEGRAQNRRVELELRPSQRVAQRAS
jgi:outer membrane protein OmpA-like peptidoglycan-associated protein